MGGIIMTKFCFAYDFKRFLQYNLKFIYKNRGINIKKSEKYGMEF